MSSLGRLLTTLITERKADATLRAGRDQSRSEDHQGNPKGEPVVTAEEYAALVSRLDALKSEEEIIAFIQEVGARFGDDALLFERSWNHATRLLVALWRREIS